MIGDDAAPRAERTVVLWNPPLLDAELGLRGSALAEAAKLQAGFVERGLRTLTFAKSRKAAELIHRFTAERLGDDSRLSPYRAGYTAEQRREIERRLAEGELLGVSVDDALELGIDIGLLDAVISVGFPGTVASLRQQWGRAGRRGHGLAVLVATEDALDQYFMREPDKLLGRRVEAAILDHANPRVLAGHVRAAAYEAPLDDADAAFLGDEALEAAAADPELRRRRAAIVWAGTRRPRPRVAAPLGRPRRVHDRRRLRPGPCSAGASDRAPTRPSIRAPSTSTWASRYLVRELDERTLRAVVEPFPGDWYTQAKQRDRDDDRSAPRARSAALGLELVFGEIEVTEQVVGYERKTIRSQERIELVPLELPAVDASRPRRSGSAPSRRSSRELDAMPKLLATLHAAEHALIAMLPLWAMCDRWDIGGLSTNLHPRHGPPDGLRLRRPPRRRRDHRARLRAVRGLGRRHGGDDRGCPCHDGCPSCVQSPKCGNLNEMLDKAGARTLLERACSSARLNRRERLLERLPRRRARRRRGRLASRPARARPPS